MAGADGRVKSPMSSAQQAVWVADGAMAGNTQYNLGRVVHCDGPLDVATLTASLAELTARHEALRTRVPDNSGPFMLEIEPPGGFHCPVIDASEAESDALAAALVMRPFTADEPALWRAEMHRLGARRHRLVIVMHHLISDAGTIALMLTEIAALYRATLAGEPPGLPAARPFSDFVAWDTDFAGSADCAAHLAYWAHQVIGVPPLDLPTDRPRQPTSRHPGEILRFTVPAQTADAARALARDHGATLAHVMLACYATLLAACARRDDLLVGMPLSIRHGRRWGTSAGLFVNTVPIKISPHGNLPFSQLVAQVRETLFAALGAADAPQTTIAARASALRRAGTGRLYDVVFGLTSRRPTIDLPGITSRVAALYAGQSKFDLHLEIIDDGQGAPLVGVLEYDTDLFDGSTAQRFCDGFAAIATAVSGSPDEPVGNVALRLRTSGADVQGPLPGGGRVDRAAQDLLIAWYAELLGLTGVTQDSDFFVVGGHSLFAARLVSRIKARFGTELSISVVYDNPRIGDLAVAVAQSCAEQSR